MFKFVSMILALLLTMFLTACSEDEGPAEQAGKNVDDAVEEMTNQVEQTGDNLQKAGEKAGEAVQDAGQRIQEQVGE